MFKIGYRTIKTAIGAALAIFVAEQLNLQFFVSAGIITILCVQKTKHKSLKSSWSRFFACVIGLSYGAIIFEITWLSCHFPCHHFTIIYSHNRIV